MAGDFHTRQDWITLALAFSVWFAHFMIVWSISIAFPGMAAGRWLALPVTLAAFGGLSLLKAAMLGVALALMTGCCSIGAARRGLDTQVLLTIAASFGLGAAMESSGAAQVLAQGALSLADGNPYLLLIGAYLVVALLTEVVTNNAAAVIAFPIAMAIFRKN